LGRIESAGEVEMVGEQRPKSQSHRSSRGYTLLEVVTAVFLMSLGVLLFGSLYPTAYRSSRMSGQYSQATSAVQHKVDQLRALGYGRLTYNELRAAGVIDASPTASPFRFEAQDNLAAELAQPVGTITVAPVRTNLRQATIRLEWRGAPGRTRRSSHAVTILIAND
jgi:type II secretory pathway pseudopilin PulG